MAENELNDHQQDVLERAEKRRRAVVAAAVELEALGCGDVFEAPIDPPEPDHASRRERIEELVDEILQRTTRDVNVTPVPTVYRYSWTSYPVEVMGHQLVVNTPEGPAAMASGVYTTHLEGEAEVPRSALEEEGPDQETRNRMRFRMLEGLTQLEKDQTGMGIGALAEAWRLLEEQVAEALAGWEAVSEERAQVAAARVYHHLDPETMLRISYVMARRAIPWTPASAVALQVGVRAIEALEWDAEGGLKPYVDTAEGRVSTKLELERLLEAAEEWEVVADGAE